MKVPFIDLKAQYDSIQEDIQTALNKVLESTAFSGGPFVAQFEKEFAAYCGCKHAIGVGSGTDALWVTLLALGIGPGDEVITVPNSFIATAEAISYCGARPVFVDIDEQTYNMDPNKLEDYLNRRFAPFASRSVPFAMRSAPKPKAVIPVHLFGQPADMDSIMEIAQKYGLFVVEDACQAHGAEYHGKKAGSIGNAGCFSFYPGKNLGAYGEAGAVVTNNDTLAEKIKIFRDHGQPVKYCHECIGWNARMDGFQGAVLGVKLRYLDEWNESRRRNARRYNNFLSSIEGIKIPKEAEYTRHVYHLYVIRTENRDELIRNLTEKNISCGIHYPLPIHMQKAYEFLGLQKGSFPVSEKYAGELVSLPMYPELTDEQIAYVVEEIKNFAFCYK
jgi:dTDP-4-amino-4,6-dideoxygalactose transaminase